MTAPQITHRSLATLTPWPRNARTHSKKQIRQIVASIRQFGFTVPVLIDEAETILAGHGRVAAATVLGLTTVPCLQLTHLSEAQKRAYVLADNKLALNAGWDEDLLATELGALLATDLDLDIGVTGFSIPEVDALLATVAPEESGDPADDALPDTAPARVRRGEVWQLGAHRLICGDVRDPAVLATLMAGEQARLVFTDPPYNVPIDGHAGGLGRITHREFAMAAGEMSPEAFTAFLQQALAPLVAHSVEGSIHYVCMDWRHLPEILAAGEAVFTALKNLVVWVKDNGGMGTFYRSRHELILVFKHGTAPHCNTFELGQHGRYRTNVWEVPWCQHETGGPDGRPGAAPDGQAGAPDRGRPPRRLGPGRDRARWVRRIWLDPDRRGKDWPPGRACAKSTPSIVTASSRAGKPMPRTTPRGWRPRGPRPPTARRWHHEPRPPAAPPDRRVRSPARGASLHARPVRQSERPPKGHHVQKTYPAA